MPRSVSPAPIFFSDEYLPDEDSISGATLALKRGGPTSVSWPERTASLLSQAVERRPGSLSDIEMWASAPSRLPRLWRALAQAGTSPSDARRGVSMFLRFANICLLNSLSRVVDRGALEDALHTLRYELFNSELGRRALGTSEPIWSIDVWHLGRKSLPNIDVYAPRSFVEGLHSGDVVAGELLQTWAIPQHELPQPRQIVRDDAEIDYGGDVVTVQKIRDELNRER